MDKLAGKVAVVTGGNSGIGFATAKLFAEQGAHVVIAGRRREAVDIAVAQLGDKAIGLTGDLADLATHERLKSLVAERFGRLDIYVANAGTISIAAAGAVDINEYDAQFATNSRAVFFGVQKIEPLMADGGAIVLVSSVASHKVVDGHAVYAGTKAAIEAFARSWALEFKARRIRMNVVCPGPVDTPILSKLGIPLADRPAFEANVSAAIPLGRFGRPEEIAKAALFLACDDSSFITGVALNVDGGFSLT